MTVWTPHQDSVTAAPVASSQASTCTNPLRIARHTASRVSRAAPGLSCPQAPTGLARIAYGAAHGKCARGRGRPVRSLGAHPAPDRRGPHRAQRRDGAGGAARGRPFPFRRGDPGSRSARSRRVRGPEDAARYHRRAGHHRHRAGRRDRDRPPVERRGGRLPHQALLGGAPLRPDVRRPATLPGRRRRRAARDRAARRRTERRPAAPPGRTGRRPARPHPPRVRPARLPGRAARGGRPPQGTPRGGLAAVLR